MPIGAVVPATPFAVIYSLVGGLLGPLGVVIGATVPYVVIVGIPALLGKLSEHWRSLSPEVEVKVEG